MHYLTVIVVLSVSACAHVPVPTKTQACELAVVASATATVNSCTAAYESAATPESLVALDAFCLEATRKLVELRDEGGATKVCTEKPADKE